MTPATPRQPAESLTESTGSANLAVTSDLTISGVPVPAPRSPQMALPPALPADAVLAHVGIHKTGTTALQSVLSQQRDLLAAQGVTYPLSASEAHHGAAMALSETRWGPKEAKGELGDPDRWPQLVEQVRRAPGRAVVSSEFFGDLRGAHAEQFVDDLGADRVHVVIGVRSLALVLPSAWQQNLKMGRSQTFASWLEKVYLGRRTSPSPRSFWSRYDYGDAVRRWSDLVGADRVSVVVLDDTDHSWQPRVFEALLDLPAGTIDGVPPLKQNRSFTAAEAEAIRRANRAMKHSVPWKVYEPTVRQGAIVRMLQRRPEPTEPRIHVPDWAVDHALAESRAAAERLRASGVRILGRLEPLTELPSRYSASPSDAERARAGRAKVPAAVQADAFAQALAGALEAAQTAGVGSTEVDQVKHKLVADVTAVDLLREIGRRGRTKLTRR